MRNGASILSLLDLISEGAVISHGTFDSAISPQDAGIDVSSAIATFAAAGATVSLIALTVAALIRQQRENIRGDNSLSTERRKTALDALDELDGIVSEAGILAVGETEKQPQYKEEERKDWASRFKSALRKNLISTFDPDNIANATLPTAIILGCGALGSAVAGPVGFGAGSVMGHLVTGQLKPGSAAKEISKSFDKEENV